jgi:uncharacterized protein (TIGR00255 family)
MVNSMTAFASSQGECTGGIVVIELRSYNHRYLDATFRLPELFRGLEPKWREKLRKTVSRGKLDCQLRFQPLDRGAQELCVNDDNLQRLLQTVEHVSAKAGVLQPLTALDVLQWPGVLDQADGGEDELLSLAGRLFNEAAEELVAARRREGENLKQFILSRLEQVATEVDKTREQMPALLAHQRERLQLKLAEIEAELDPQRLEQELVMLAQKADVEEELDRLHSHIGEVQLALDKGGTVGRRLDFLMQEFNREANTLSSKSIASATTQNAVELKVLIEQMREQIQNLE